MKTNYLAFLTLLLFHSIAGLCQCNGGFAPIPNQSFEQWVSRGSYIDPVDWVTNNDSVYAPVVRDSVDKIDSSYSMRVEHSGIVRSKKFLLRHDWFIASYKYTIAGADSIIVRLIRYRSGTAVDSIQNVLTNTANWQQLAFTQYAIYSDSVEVLVIGGKLPGTTINMDCLIQYAEDIKNVINGQKVTLYPNPVDRFAILRFNNKQHDHYNLSILSVDGKTVYQDMANAGETFMINCSGLTAGLYFWKLSSPESNEYAAGKIIVD